MQKNRKTSSFVTVALALLIVVSTAAASVMAGCGESSESEKETKAVTETSVVTKTIESTYYEYETDSAGNYLESSDSTKKQDSDNKSSSNSSKSQNNSNSSNSGSNASNSNGSSAVKNNQNSSSSSSNKPASSKVCSIDGNKFRVGEKVTCEYKITAPEKLEDFAGTVKYDSKYLKVDIARPSQNMVMNINIKNKILFNGVNISGYDFRNGGTLLTVVYEVVGEGSTKTDIAWDDVTGVSKSGSGTAFIVDGKPVKGFKYSKTYK